MTDAAPFRRFLQKKLKAANLLQHKDRLEEELDEIEAQDECEYFLKLLAKNVRFSENPNNLLVPFLLGITDQWDPDQPPAYQYGEFPDIDIDYIQSVRDYLKNEYAAKEFGSEFVCAIGTYGTLKVKMALLDMARVHGCDHTEIQAVTKKLPNKDVDGKDLSWERALEISPELTAYCEANPVVANAAKMMLNRRRSTGVHAGGLVISSKKIDDFVPLEVRSVTKDSPNGVVASAWTEGLATSELQPVGLIKFDFLVVSALEQISLTVRLLKQRYGFDRFKALEGQRDWTDTSYLEDEASLATANSVNLMGIFQFDSPGIRQLVKMGGVTEFADLPAYSSLHRPGPLNMGMHEVYCRRKKGHEDYSIHPLLRPILEKTYGVLIYQESIIKILNKVGDIPLIHCNEIRKAISKKKEKVFAKYKEQFIKNGMNNLQQSQDELEELFQQIVSFASYGFNSSHAVAYAYISAQQLYLKTHHPNEFFTALLTCESDYDKIKSYMHDAKLNGVTLLPLDLNESKKEFRLDLENNCIWYGFQKIKGIGEQACDQLVSGQPYNSLLDLLTRFGTDSKVVKPLIALGCFGDKIEQVETAYEEFKSWVSKTKAKVARAEKSMRKYEDQLDLLVSQHLDLTNSEKSLLLDFHNPEQGELAKKHDTLFSERYTYKGEERVREKSFHTKFCEIKKRWQTAKEKISSQAKDTFDQDFSVVCTEQHLDLLDRQTQLDYYGFIWRHPLEKMPRYTGLTINKLMECEDDVGRIEVQVTQPFQEALSKNNKKYYRLQIEDADCIEGTIIFWENFYKVYKDQLKPGVGIRVIVKKPENGFPSFLLHNPSSNRYRRTEISEDTDPTVLVFDRTNLIDE